MFYMSKKSNDGYMDFCKMCTDEKEYKLKQKKDQKIQKREEVEFKKCNQCGLRKNIDSFFKNKNTEDGYYNRCKDCCFKYNMINNIKNNITLNDRIKKTKKIGVRKCIQCGEIKNIIYFYKNKKHSSGYSSTCALCKRKESEKYRSIPEIIKKRKEYGKEYRLRPEIIKKRREYNKKRKKQPRVKIYNSVSSLIRDRLQQRGSGKNGRSSFGNILPYTLDDLMFHLEFLFEPKMTWENHGNGNERWNIDHVIPDSWFNYKNVDDNEFQKSWALNNLQPMWFNQNMKKNNKYSGKYKGE